MLAVSAVALLSRPYRSFLVTTAPQPGSTPEAGSAPQAGSTAASSTPPSASE
jgi:hypothetical protein